MQENKTPLRKFGVFKMKIMSVAKESFKSKGQSKEKLVVSFCDDQDRWIDANFLLPMNKWSKAGYDSLLKEAGVMTPKELKGKTLVVLIAPQETDGGKVWWNPKKYFNESFVKYITTGDDPFGMDPADADEFRGLDDATAEKAAAEETTDEFGGLDG